MSNASFNNFLSNKGYGPIMKDYQHASKLYVDGLTTYSRAPKFGFIYFVQLNLGIKADNIVDERWGVQQVNEVGLLAKKVELPKFNIETETLNQYNRKTVIQKKLSYNSISIDFHDDNSDITHKLWVNYYKHYFSDSRQDSRAFNDTKYGELDYQYGMYDNGNKEPFLKSIDIFVLHGQEFTQFTLVNPKIKEWRHDTVDQSAGNKILQNTMSLDYENVLYKEGYVWSGLKQMTAVYYDKESSPNSIAGIQSNDVVYNTRPVGAFDQRQFNPKADRKYLDSLGPNAAYDKKMEQRIFGAPQKYDSSAYDKKGKSREYGAIRPKTAGLLEQLGTILLKNYVNSNGLTRQSAAAYNIAGSVMKQTLSSGAGKYSDPPSTESQPGVFTLPGGIGINVFKGFNTTVDGGIRANPAAILFPPRQ